MIPKQIERTDETLVRLLEQRDMILAEHEEINRRLRLVVGGEARMPSENEPRWIRVEEKKKS